MSAEILLSKQLYLFKDMTSNWGVLCMLKPRMLLFYACSLFDVSGMAQEYTYCLIYLMSKCHSLNFN